MTEIRPFLEDGGVALTPNARLNPAIREHPEANLEPSSVMASPRIFPVDGWLEGLWRAQAITDHSGGTILLSEQDAAASSMRLVKRCGRSVASVSLESNAQDLHLWRRVILESE